MKEFAQFFDLDFFDGIMADIFTKEHKKAALHALNLIKLRRNDVLKGRTVADGRKQRTLYSKEETTSSTCHNDSLMMTVIIDSLEE